MNARVRRRPERDPATVVLAGAVTFVEDVDHDTVQVLALSAGLSHTWDSVAGRWTFRTEDALRLAAALRTAGRTVRLAITATEGDIR